MVSEIIDGYGAKLVIAVIVVAAALFLLFLVSRMLRNRGSAGQRRTGTGGRPRLAVLDSIAVDANRRLVLVRRDEVEHLILIGGPSDVVVESRIGLAADARSAVSPAPPERRAPLAAPAPIAPRADTKPPVRPVPLPPAPAKEAAAQVQVRQPTVRPPVAADATRANGIEADDPAAWPAGPRPSPAPEEVRRDVEDVLDDARGRVFGASSAPEADPVPPARQQPAAKSVQPTGGIEPAARFEDVLDAEIAGDLSAVTPGAAGRAPAVDPRAAPPLSERPKGGPVVDAEMTRLLGELSVKR